MALVEEETRVELEEVKARARSVQEDKEALEADLANVIRAKTKASRTCVKVLLLIRLFYCCSG